ncbi:MAG: succinate dehydrogenase cytochrome b subunit [Flavobacteriales bacterium]|nr:succinate dehydrogenase cytochrome b subunit [Bacteroidota bacterium]MCB9241593.1 succinate dehydrogenase cytochrome b subunit [Flavobacteriales bacterium]
MALIQSSIARKIVMAVTGLFLISFIALHLAVNLLTLVSADAFNEASHFMGTNPFIQIMQYVLALGFILHIAMGIQLTMKNRQARPVAYAMNKPAENSSWSSRNMIVTGLLILLFLVLHIKDYFWEIKFGDMSMQSDFELVTTLFQNPLYTFIYLFSFILLGFHLDHGFQSAFQSVGANHYKYTPLIKLLGRIFSVIVAIGFSAISLYFYLSSL